VQSYEDLTGGRGRAAHYRAERFRPRVLFRGSAPRLEVDGRSVRIGDVSSTGLCFDVDADAPRPAIGEVVGYRLRVDGRDAVAGRGTVVRVDPGGDAMRVGLQFTDRLVEPDALRAVDADAAFERAVSLGVEAYAAVPGEYRSACADVQLFLAHWQSLLDSREADLAGRSDAGDRLADATDTAFERMRGEWRALREAAGKAADRIDERDAGYAPARALTGVLLAPFLARSPFLHRCRTKPRGYPGDFVAMSWMYEGQAQGDTLFGRALDRLGLEEQLARTVPDRRDALIAHLDRLVEAGAARPMRILNIGAGPARELHDWLDRLPPGPILEIVLVDQDEAALAFAHDRVARAALRHGGRVRVTGRHLSFRQLFEEPAELDPLRGCSLVYSAGLFDYLRRPVAEALIAQCFGLLEPGGRLLVGNAAAAPIVRWLPEYALDWKMIYRTREEMLDLAAAAAGRAEVSLGADASGSWHLLAMTRRDEPGSVASGTAATAIRTARD